MADRIFLITSRTGNGSLWPCEKTTPFSGRFPVSPAHASASCRTSGNSPRSSIRSKKLPSYSQSPRKKISSGTQQPLRENPKYTANSPLSCGWQDIPVPDNRGCIRRSFETQTPAMASKCRHGLMHSPRDSASDLLNPIPPRSRLPCGFVRTLWLPPVCCWG